MREEVRSHRALAELADRQYRVVSHAQLLQLGYSKSAVGRAVRAGRLHRVHRGVYAVGSRRLNRRGRCLAAAMACGKGALLSHWSAAWLWGLERQCPATVEVTVPRAGRTRSSIRVHHAPALREEDRSLAEGIPVTAVPRTLLDLAAVVPAARIERLIERCEQLKLFDLRQIDSLLGRVSGHRGAARLHGALDLYREPGFTRSRLERRFLALVSRAGLPLPATNHFVAGHELDMYWAHERFAVELDGFEHHRTRAAFERDRLRQEELKLSGIEMIRITDRRLVREPELVIERLAELLERRRAGSPKG